MLGASSLGEDDRGRGIRYSDLWEPTPHGHTLRESSERDYCVRDSSSVSHDIHGLRPLLGATTGDSIPRELFDLRTRDLNISEKELHVYLIPVCPHAGRSCARDADVRRGKGSVVVFDT